MIMVLGKEEWEVWRCPVASASRCAAKNIALSASCHCTPGDTHAGPRFRFELVICLELEDILLEYAVRPEA